MEVTDFPSVETSVPIEGEGSDRLIMGGASATSLEPIIPVAQQGHKTNT